MRPAPGEEAEAMTALSALARQSRATAMPQARPPAAQPAEPENESIRSAVVAGWSIIALFFGVLGAWAMSAPLNGAVVAQAVVKVEGNRKSVQHLDGGIVKELRVKEGDRVAAGAMLIVLDETQARAELDVLRQQYLVLRATEGRLRAELARAGELVMPEELSQRIGHDPDLPGIWRGQRQQFESRAAALEGQRKVIKEKIAQLEAQIVGGEAQVKSYRTQLESVRQELESLAPLLKQGLVARPRYLQLERSGAALEGQAADASAAIARARQAIAEQGQQMAQLDNERMTEVAKDLRDTQARLLEVIPRLMNAKAVLGRMEIRAPYAGQVVGLSVFSVGGVINRGDRILDIVPDVERLVIEAQIAVDDISDVRPDMPADVHLTAYKARITPVVRGRLAQVSADRLTDSKSGSSYYTGLVEVDREELARHPEVKLYPGMPAMVMLPTVERTAFDYLVGPLAQSFNRSFRQR